MALENANIKQIFQENPSNALDPDAILLFYDQTTNTTRGILAADVFSNSVDLSAFQWSSTAIYSQNDPVLYNGQWWISDVDSNQGNIPANNAFWTSENKVSSVTIQPWTAGIYDVNYAIVSVGTKIYRLKGAVSVPFNSQTSPDSDLTNWEIIGGEELADGSVTNAKLADMSAYRIKGRTTGTGSPQDLTKSDLQEYFDMIVKGNNGDAAIILQPGASVYDLVDGLFRVQHASFGVDFQLSGGDLSYKSDQGTYRKNIVIDATAQQIRLEIRNKSTDALIQSLILDADGLRRGVASTGSDALEIVERGALSVYAQNPNPSDLTDGSAISWDWASKYFELKRLTTTNTAITLTLSNIVAGANQVLSVIKNTASDVTITLAGTGLSFYGYDGAGYSTTPNIVLSGALGDIFELSFLARTTTSIGVAVGNNGN